jgi:uncharacterized OsmC-like protein
MGTLTVRHLEGDRFAVAVRGHVMTVDQPVPDGGEDTAPTPTELFVASLAACVAFYARRYLDRHGLSATGLAVTTDFSMGQHPARVTEIHVEVRLPEGIPAKRRDAILAVASHCTVHNSLADPPVVTVALTDARATAA